MQKTNVTLHVRVWIEMIRCLLRLKRLAVTLHVRVWIEIELVLGI